MSRALKPTTSHARWRAHCRLYPLAPMGTMTAIVITMISIMMGMMIIGLMS